jgi:hypothetical protein
VRPRRAAASFLRQIVNIARADTTGVRIFGPHRETAAVAVDAENNRIFVPLGANNVSPDCLAAA